MKFPIIIFTVILTCSFSQAAQFDLKKDIRCRIDDGEARVNSSRDDSLSYVNQQEQQVLNMIQQVAGEMKTIANRLGKSLLDYVDQYRQIPQYKQRGDRIWSIYSQLVKNTENQVDNIRSKSLPIAIKKTPEAITEDLRSWLYTIAGDAYGDLRKYISNNDQYNCRYGYHTRLIADYYLFAAKNNGYCVDFLNYQIYGDAAEMLQLISDHFDRHIDLAEECMNAQSDLEATLAVSIWADLYFLIKRQS